MPGYVLISGNKVSRPCSHLSARMRAAANTPSACAVRSIPFLWLVKLQVTIRYKIVSLMQS